jgi:hypothetical protein
MAISDNGLVVWETLDSRGRATGSVAFSAVAGLPRALGVRRVVRRGGRLTISYTSYATPGRPQVYSWRRGAWRPIRDDRLGTRTITIRDARGAQLYRVYKGGFWSRMFVR